MKKKKKKRLSSLQNRCCWQNERKRKKKNQFLFSINRRVYVSYKNRLTSVQKNFLVDELGGKAYERLISLQSGLYGPGRRRKWWYYVTCTSNLFGQVFIFMSWKRSLSRDKSWGTFYARGPVQAPPQQSTLPIFTKASPKNSFKFIRFWKFFRKLILRAINYLESSISRLHFIFMCAYAWCVTFITFRLWLL